MDPFSLAAIGLAITLTGKILGAAGEAGASERKEREMRTRAEQSRELSGMSTALRRDVARDTFQDTRRDVRLQEGRAGSTLTAASAAAGVRGDSGSVGAVRQDIGNQADRAVTDARESLNFQLEQINIDALRDQYDAESLERGADQERRNRNWNFLSNALDFFNAGIGGGDFITNNVSAPKTK